MSKRGKEFIDVSSMGVITTNVTAPGQTGDGVLVRDQYGTIKDCLAVLPDGHFRGRYGKVHKDDLGTYILKAVGHHTAS